jgi:lysophospholipase L1-like esterase
MKCILICLLFFTFFVQAQDPERFADQVDAIQKKYDTLWEASIETIVFTGSSSVRFWNDLQDRFPNHQIVNSGFGGSQASDLFAYTNELILRYQPKKVFIYEGDNDIAAGKGCKEIIIDLLAIIDKIRAQNPSVEIVLIAAKPSIARWDLKSNYKRLNRKFKKLSRKDAELHYADVWKPMLVRRKVMTDIFIEDGLHMNAKGYAIWYGVLKEFIEN